MDRKEKEQPEEPAIPDAVGQAVGGVAPAVTGQQVPATGGRAAFSALRRELTEEDLASGGVQRMLLYLLDLADKEVNDLKQFRDQYIERDRRVAVLEEKQKTVTAIEITFGVGVAIGSAIMGLAPFFWDAQGHGVIALALGALLIAGSTALRVVKR